MEDFNDANNSWNDIKPITKTSVNLLKITKSFFDSTSYNIYLFWSIGTRIFGSTIYCF